MDAFTMVRELAGSVELTADQLAQVRALNVRYQTGLYRLLQSGEADAGEREAGLRAGLYDDLVALLAREQNGR